MLPEIGNFFQKMFLSLEEIDHPLFLGGTYKRRFMIVTLWNH